jgi:hypothetical protein
MGIMSSRKFLGFLHVFEIALLILTPKASLETWIK